MSSKTQPLLAKSLTELTEWVESLDLSAYRAKQIHQWLYRKQARSLLAMSDLPKSWRETHQAYPVGRSTLEQCRIAPDQTRKYLLRLEDGLIIETVGIPSAKRLTVCVSSQVGCAMDCGFCATGKGGFVRNLQAHEIVDQVLTVQEDFQERVSHVVFMGMGEPLSNLVAMERSIHSINQDIGIGQRSLTVSTVGLPQKIKQLAQRQLQITLAVSLHAPNQGLRQELIPSARHYPLPQLLADCRSYVQETGRRVSFEYILLAGINDHPQLALELAQILRGFQSHVNLIPYNPIAEADYQRPAPQAIEAFSEMLTQNHIPVSVRYSRGLEADAACGQLRATLQGVQGTKALKTL